MDEYKNRKKQDAKKEKSGKLMALKAFLIVHNGFRMDIKKGDCLDKLPEKFLANMYTEGVLKKN